MKEYNNPFKWVLLIALIIAFEKINQTFCFVRRLFYVVGRKN